MNPLRYVDDFLNGITMYRLLLYGLAAVAGVAVVFSLTGTLPYSWDALLASMAVLVTVCYVSNKLISIILEAATNTESALITGLILWCIMPPSTDPDKLAWLALTGLIAMASKYFISWRREHIFNPAAIAAAIMGLTGLISASWWIGSKSMLPAVLILGLLVTRKVRRFKMVGLFALISVVMIVWLGLGHSQGYLSLAEGAFTSWPLVFLGTIMLTEPSTMPPRPRLQLVYALIVALVFTSQLHYWRIFSTPEIALVVGNIFSYLVSPKYKLRLTLKEKIRLNKNSWEFVFTPDRKFGFLPGQYMEWTLPHRRPDARGNRRTFTIASSPTEKQVRLGVKTYKPSSTYKTALLNMQKGNSLIAGEIGGGFTFPADTHEKLLLVAGGIGITPFRSMLKYMIDTNENRDIVLLYVVSGRSDVVYQSVLEAAEKLGVHVVPIIGSKGATADNIRKFAPDFAQRKIMISGPNAMIRTWRNLLLDSGASTRHITTDYFPGY
jgi:ferredoxin-NADP reductase